MRLWGKNWADSICWTVPATSCPNSWRCSSPMVVRKYWLKSFDEFLEPRFPESRRKAYYLRSIHEHLPAPFKRELKQVGWTKGLELAKLARRKDGQEFDCATWLHKARELPKEEFRREVENADRKRHRTVGARIFQALQEPDSGS